MRSSFVVGLIAGAIAGIVPFVQYHLYTTIGYWIWEPDPFPYTIGFLVNQATVHIGFNGIWGAIFGIFFAMIFDRIPGKGIKKGLTIGLIYYLFSIVQPAYFFWVYDNTIWAGYYLIGLYFFDKFIYGIIFTYLYKKPTEAIAIKEEKIETFKLKNCRHCGASIPKDSIFCKKCGKKQ